MAIVESDLIHRYSGSGQVSDPDASIGGAINTADPAGIIVSDVDNNDMDDITSTEADIGIVIYRGYFYENAHATLTWIGPVFWIESQTNSGSTDVEIAIADEAKNTDIEILPSEIIAPSGGVSFTPPADKAAGIIIGDLDAGDFRGHWVRYSVTAGATTLVDQYTIRAEGDTLP